VDTEGFVLKAKVQSAKVLDQEGVKPLLEQAGNSFCASSTCGWTAPTGAEIKAKVG
jgi:hypothetical protein